MCGAFGSEAQTARRSMKETQAERLLEPLQPVARDCNRQMQAACGGADRAEVEHTQEQIQVGDAIHERMSGFSKKCRK
jgi:hypothetical protein